MNENSVKLKMSDTCLFLKVGCSLALIKCSMEFLYEAMAPLFISPEDEMGNY